MQGWTYISVRTQTKILLTLHTRQLGLIPVSQSPGGCSGIGDKICKYHSEMIYFREKLLRFRRMAIRNRKSSIGGLSSQSQVEVIIPSHNYIFQLSDELLLRILSSLDVKDLTR